MSDDINNRLVNYLIHKSKDQVIDKFEDYFSFLSNDEPSWIFYENLLFPSVSVAFQAARASDLETKEKISQVDSPDELIELAQGIEDPLDWESRRLKVMEILIRDKFRRSLEMRERLRLTEEKYDEESASNLYWGIVGNKGQNQIGRILERVRGDIVENSDLKKWLLTKFALEKDKILLPVITLNVQKEGQLIESITLKERSYYYMGQYKTNSVLLAHPSISRLHACVICEENNKVRLVDMESKSGSFVNGDILEKLQDRELQSGDRLSFALSSRVYEIIIDYSQAKKELQNRSIQLQQQVKHLSKLNQPTLTAQQLRDIMGFPIDNTLFVSGLPPNSNIIEIQKLFSQHAQVKEVKIPLDKWSGKQRGFAYVIFSTQEDFSKAFLHSMNLKYGDSKLKVKIADQDKSSQLMNICRISDENDKERDNNKTRNYDRSRNYENPRNYDNNNHRSDRNRNNDRYNDYRRRRSNSKSRSRSDEKINKNRLKKEDRKDRSSKFDKQEQNQDSDKSIIQDKDKEIIQNLDEEKKDIISSSKQLDSQRKRSISKHDHQSKTKRKDRSDSHNHRSNTKKSKSSVERKMSKSPKSNKTQASKHSKSRSRDRKDKSRERTIRDRKDKSRDRKDKSKDRKQKTEKNDISKDKKERSRDRKDTSRDRKDKSRDRKDTSKERKDTQKRSSKYDSRPQRKSRSRDRKDRRRNSPKDKQEKNESSRLEKQQPNKQIDKKETSAEKDKQSDKLELKTTSPVQEDSKDKDKSSKDTEKSSKVEGRNEKDKNKDRSNKKKDIKESGKQKENEKSQKGRVEREKSSSSSSQSSNSSSSSNSRSSSSSSSSSQSSSFSITSSSSS